MNRTVAKCNPNITLELRGKRNRSSIICIDHVKSAVQQYKEKCTVMMQARWKDVNHVHVNVL